MVSGYSNGRSQHHTSYGNGISQRQMSYFSNCMPSSWTSCSARHGSRWIRRRGVAIGGSVSAAAVVATAFLLLLANLPDIGRNASQCIGRCRFPQCVHQASFARRVTARFLGWSALGHCEHTLARNQGNHSAGAPPKQCYHCAE